MEVRFEFAKKMNKPSKGMPGITLRSISGSAESCSMIIMADSYDDIRAQVQNYRLLTARSIKAVSRGKSLEIKAEAAPEEDIDAVSLIFDFARGIKFNMEDVLDVMDFWQKAFKGSDLPALKPDSIELSEGSLGLLVVAQIDDDCDPDTIYGSFDPICENYGIGMVKKRPDSL